MGTIRFLLGEETMALTDPDPTLTVLDYLREQRGRTGTREGCAEGDCGACTVVLGEPTGAGLRYRAVNSCLQFLPTLDGKQLLSVEDLQNPDGSLHPVQQALVDTHGSQCGFCTPGFVMSLFALYQAGGGHDRARVNDALAGNLCRCTGYRPIVDAALAMGGADRHERFRAGAVATAARLRALRRDDMLALRHGERCFSAPRDLDELAALYLRHPEAHLLAGGTDMGLWVTKDFRELAMIIYLGEVAGLRTLAVHDDHLSLGAALSYRDAHATLAGYYPDIGELLRRLGSEQIRNLGTLGGNIANASPISDTPPALLALDASLLLRRGGETRELPLAEFFLDYRRTALQAGEFIQAIRVPLPTGGDVFRCYKISKRFDQDISALCGAFSLRLRDQRVVVVRVAFGGMAATPKRASHCEQALLGEPWNEATVAAGVAALAKDFNPLSDHRAGREYRLRVAGNLLRKCYLETTRGESLRVVPPPVSWAERWAIHAGGDGEERASPGS